MPFTQKFFFVTIIQAVIAFQTRLLVGLTGLLVMHFCLYVLDSFSQALENVSSAKHKGTNKDKQCQQIDPTTAVAFAPQQHKLSLHTLPAWYEQQVELFKFPVILFVELLLLGIIL